ncbi:cytidine deaminase [Sneathiella chinensis]|uniref:Cytidine deaminase n=1 Tax=Sneathiella chinensis TaxID=349750 RepID=A0ABQ5U2Z1_9PROT|nr:cytidine deaminase [Sneathiella chinensis]GLQ05613.1 cytidine deaminase [Sneathiella chinensis]
MTKTTDSLHPLAEDILEQAYAPYSNFRVGAALKTEAGNIFTGCNVENVSFGLTQCAERNAIAKAVASEGPTMKIQEIFVANRNQDNQSVPCSPCGACRQVIAEFAASSDTLIHYQGQNGAVTVTMDALLPDSFRF